jgi:hypothetical protein
MRRTATLQQDLKFDNLEGQPKRGIFEGIFWLNSSFFSGDDQDILKEHVNTYIQFSATGPFLKTKTFLLAQSSHLNSRFHFHLHIIVSMILTLVTSET